MLIASMTILFSEHRERERERGERDGKETERRKVEKVRTCKYYDDMYSREVMHLTTLE